ncbi:Flp pilus assembly complex ATPase component TadA [Alcaligenaceae bacterium]|nr:Flp pilus assembly complex ATPase component TadA [Alcaligenaceae bacterium]
MLHLELRFEDGLVRTASFPLPLEVGRGPDSHLRLKAWRVGKRHARLEWRPAGIFIEDFGSLSGTLVNGIRVAEHGPLQVGDEILIGPCLMCLNEIEESFSVAQPALPASKMDAAGQQVADHDPIMHYDPAPALNTVNAVVSASTECPLSVLLFHRRRLHTALLEALDLRRRDIASMSDDALRSEASAALSEIIATDTELPTSIERSALLLEVVNEAVGLGPLEPLLADQTVTEIMVNRHDEIFVEINGQLKRHTAVFSSEQAVLGVIDRIVSPLGRRIDESSPMVDARLRDGSRVNAVLAPVALRGSSLTIRKFPQKRPNMNDLLQLQAFDDAIQTFLAESVRSKKNLIVSGGTGSGKTTLLNVLSNCIPRDERIVTIEDAAELKLDHPHLVALESRPANLEGRGTIAIRDLVRNALRMRPDRIVVGECRGGEAFDMLAAMNTGHEGSLTTLHANSPRDALARLETMILMAGMDLPLLAVREHIAASIHFIIQQARLSNGRRLITSIVEITGMESGRIQTQELFKYVRGPTPAFTGCGVIPECFIDETGAPALQAALFDMRTELAPQAIGPVQAF